MIKSISGRFIAYGKKTDLGKIRLLDHFQHLRDGNIRLRKPQRNMTIRTISEIIVTSGQRSNKK
ncbi:MAG: hypothetical protein ACOVQS_01010 [Chitinophagaceae bacterium]